ncbi:L-Aspartase-like protein [Amanita rubescens]|nr:L-Aspartase-like protein [Amanita rubescens]
MTILSGPASETSAYQRRSSIASPLAEPETKFLRTVTLNTFKPGQTPSGSKTPLLQSFIESFRELEGYKNGKSIVVDGYNLSIAAVTAASRYNASVSLDKSVEVNDRLDKSRKVVTDKIDGGISIYGVSTGFGGSADTRTDQPLLLGNALLQHQPSGVLPSTSEPLEVLPLLDPLASTSMPESWVKGAILIRMNSLIRGHSGVRPELIEKMNELLSANVTPLVPMRSSISASGDLSSLSYVAGTLIGNPAIRVFDGPRVFGGRKIVPSSKALEAHNIAPISLASKEHLGILNGTAFSASVASLALNDAVHLALLTQIVTAMSTEALKGTRLNYHKFIGEVARPHPGQVEAAKIMWDLLEGSKFAVTHEEELTIKEDEGTLRQDRYSLRTAPQFIGPQVEDLLESLKTVTRECNTTTDNPLFDGETGEVHHGGNFQAMAVSNAMEKTRLGLHHLGKITFAQLVELINPAMNRGLPPSLAATDPSLNYHGKAIDIASAAYVAELGYLANPVSTHIQSAEMHNQSVNSLALISARQTLNSLEILSILLASHIYMICQAYDLRALQAEFGDELKKIVSQELSDTFGHALTESETSVLLSTVVKAMAATLESTSTMDAVERMHKVAASSTPALIDFLTGSDVEAGEAAVASTTSIPEFHARVASRAASYLKQLQTEYLTGARGPAPAASHLNKTRPIYEFVRVTLGIKMHGIENLHAFENGLGVEDVTPGQHVSRIHEAIRDGNMQSVIVNMWS